MSAIQPLVPPEPQPAHQGEPGWRRSRVATSLADVYRSVPIGRSTTWRKLLAFAGPGYLVAVGYMDPGNWATDLAGGSRFGYALLSVILISNLMAVLLQGLASKLGIVTGRDLAQACRDHYSTPVVWALWFLCEIAIAACDLAEVIGSAIALNLLFGISLPVGVCITALDVLLLLYLQNKGVRILEALVITLVATVGVCFAFELLLARPDIGDVMRGFIPTTDIISDREKLYIAIGILGATVMPHNLYLHSSIVQTRKYAENAAGKREAVRYAFIDSTIALSFALFINASILIVAASTFHTTGNTQVAEIQDAYKLLTPLLGAGASTVFALALLASGQISTLTGKLAGQIVMEGFLNIRMRPWLR
ncbi:MAG: manganese transporter, partial [Geminicoccaceae bacterium]|nr:manganese transporter [Geminicoccaceae bacterium]